MMMNLMTVLVKKVFISSKPSIVCLLCPPPCGPFSIQESAVGGLSYKAKKRPDSSGLFGVKHGGFEPPTTWLKVRCSTDWASIPYHRKMPRTGIEPVTRGFSVLCSTNWATKAHVFLYELLWVNIQNCGGRIWTYDLRVMSPTSFQTAPPRAIN